MKWLVFGVLLCFAKLGAGGSLSRTSRVKETAPESDQNVDPVRCKPNTTLTMGCNTCICLESGYGLCTAKDCKNTESEKATEESEMPLEVEETTKKTAKSSLEKIRNLLTQLSLILEFIEENQRKLNYENVNDLEDNNIDLDDGELQIELTTKTNRKHITVDSINKIGNKKEIEDLSDTDDGELQVELTTKTNQNDMRVDSNEHNKVGKTLEKEDHVVLKRSVCKPNQVFQSECNTCKCEGNGQSYTCTHNECMEGETNKEVEVFMEGEGTDHIEQHSVCKPRGTFYIGCNTCHCNFFGTDYSCTNKPCPLPEDVELFHELKMIKASQSQFNKTQRVVCVANRMFIKDCNTCWCNDDGTGFFCTRKVCVQEIPDDAAGLEDKQENLRIIEKECRPDEVFELDCNMCRCNPDGKSFSCTRRACVEMVDEVTKNMTTQRRKRDTKTEPEKTKNCQPGQEFRLDCNKCLCDDEGQDFSCTRNDCHATTNHFSSASVGARTKRDTLRDTSENISMECAAGSVFDRDCNVCRCTGDGHHAVCTLKRCVVRGEDDKAESAAEVTDVDPNFRCNPGEQFKRGCNDCTCSADGKSVFCTLLFCDEH